MNDLPIKVEKEYTLFIKGERIGTIHNIRENWPAFEGEFEPTETFASYQDLFAKATAPNSTFSDEERRSALESVLNLGIELRSPLSNHILSRTPSKVIRGEIGYVYVANGKAWFRLFHASLPESEV